MPNPPENKLLPCPFCQESAVRKHDTHQHETYALYHKVSCYFSGVTWLVGQEQINLWNTRPTPQPAELTKDKERLDWFDKNVAWQAAGQPLIDYTKMRPKELRTAIDAAISQQNNKKEGV